MKLYIYMFGSLMKLGVTHKFNGTLIIKKQQGGFRLMASQVLKQAPNPHDIFGSCGGGDIF